MGTRVIGALAIIGGASWGILVFFAIFYTPEQWTGTIGIGVLLLMLAGSLGLAGAMIGLAWLFQDEVRSPAGLAAAVGSLAIILETMGAYGAIGVVPIASTVLVWELAHIGVLSRALVVVHGVTAAVFLALVVSSRIDYAATLSSHLFVALGGPYMLTWIVIGAAFIRGVRAAHEPAIGG